MGRYNYYPPSEEPVSILAQGYRAEVLKLGSKLKLFWLQNLYNCYLHKPHVKVGGVIHLALDPPFSQEQKFGLCPFHLQTIFRASLRLTCCVSCVSRGSVRVSARWGQSETHKRVMLSTFIAPPELCPFLPPLTRAWLSGLNVCAVLLVEFAPGLGKGVGTEARLCPGPSGRSGR